MFLVNSNFVLVDIFMLNTQNSRNIHDGSHQYLPTASLAIKKLATNPQRGLLAFVEGGVEPSILIYEKDNWKNPIWKIKGSTDLDLADLQFSADGTRLYALQCAQEHALRVYSVPALDSKTGPEPLPGSELTLDTKFDRASVCPINKDKVALVQTTNVRMVTTQKSYKTFLTHSHEDVFGQDNDDLRIVQFLWTPKGNFLISTRCGKICVVDGTHGYLTGTYTAQSAITAMMFTRLHLITAHLDGRMRYWRVREESFGQERDYTPIEDSQNKMHNPSDLDSPFQWLEYLELENALEADMEIQQQKEHTDYVPTGSSGSNVPFSARVQALAATPSWNNMVAVTAAGRIWKFGLETQEQVEAEVARREQAEADDDEEELKVVHREDERAHLASMFHTRPIVNLGFLGQEDPRLASLDEAGKMLVTNSTTGDVKQILQLGAAQACFATCVTGKYAISGGADDGVIRVINTAAHTQLSVAGCVRIGDAPVVVVDIKQETKETHAFAAVTEDDKIHLGRIGADGAVSVLGYTTIGGQAVDASLNVDVDGGTPAQLIVTGMAGSGANERPALWSVDFPALDYEPTNEELPRGNVFINDIGKPGDAPPTCITVAAPNSGTTKSDQCLVGMADGCVAQYGLPTAENVAEEATAQLPCVVASQSSNPHKGPVTGVEVVRAPDGQTIICSASVDGAVKTTPLPSGGASAGGRSGNTMLRTLVFTRTFFFAQSKQFSFSIRDVVFVRHRTVFQIAQT